MTAPARAVGFSAEELAPSTGAARPANDLATVVRVAEAIGRYGAIRIDNARHRTIASYLERVTAVGLVNAGGRQLGGRALGPSGTGKTTSAETFRAAYEARGLHEPGDVPIVIVPLDRACTSRRLFAAVLRALGDPQCDKGSEDVLRTRAYVMLRRLRVRLLVIDEVQHLVARGERSDICDVLKRFLDDGVVPLVLLGVDDAAETLDRNRQLSMRLHAPCDVPPLRRADGSDRGVFRAYVADLDQAMLDAGLARRLSQLADKRTLSCLFAVTGGVLGRISALVREALAHSVARSAELVEVCDLSAATRSWAVGQGLIDYDPFVTGVRPATAACSGGTGRSSVGRKSGAKVR